MARALLRDLEIAMPGKPMQRERIGFPVDPRTHRCGSKTGPPERKSGSARARRQGRRPTTIPARRPAMTPAQHRAARWRRRPRRRRSSHSVPGSCCPPRQFPIRPWPRRGQPQDVVPPCLCMHARREFGKATALCRNGRGAAELRALLQLSPITRHLLPWGVDTPRPHSITPAVRPLRSARPGSSVGRACD